MKWTNFLFNVITDVQSLLWHWWLPKSLVYHILMFNSLNLVIKARMFSIRWVGMFGPQKSRTTDTQWRHKSKKSENLGRCGRQNMLRPYLKIWEWEWIFGRAVKAISSPCVRSPWRKRFPSSGNFNVPFFPTYAKFTKYSPLLTYVRCFCLFIIKTLEMHSSRKWPIWHRKCQMTKLN